MKKLFDLRFVIGVFFTAVGLLLVGYHLSSGDTGDLSKTVNLRSGIVYTLFGIVMIGLSYTKTNTEDQPE